MKKFCFISDTHWLHNKFEVGSGDFLIHSGDASMITADCVEKFSRWMSGKDFRHLVFVPGNHDEFLESNTEEAVEIMESYGIHVLIDQEIILEGLKFYGSPYTPTFGYWSFMESPSALKLRWRNIPMDTDILITHGPPKYMLDGLGYGMAGCDFLSQKVFQVNPIIHGFGHIHPGYGAKTFHEILFINSAVCPGFDDPRGKVPFIVELDGKKVNDFYPLGFS